MAVSRQSWRNNPRARGLREGYRSGLEELNAKHLTANKVPLVFEKVKIKYIIPATERTYSLDFELLDNGIMVETKGKFEPADRAKHLYIRLQHPDLDIRFVFQRPNEAISKGSETTYALWAEKHGFKWAAKVIPLSWAREPGKPGPRGERTIQVSPEVADLFGGPARKPNAAIRGAARSPAKATAKAKRPA
jgi:hypothetical protein